MNSRLYFAFFIPLLGLACSGSDAPTFDSTTRVATDLGEVLDKDRDGYADQIDIDDDGTLDGMGVDRNGDGKLDALLLDTDCDGYFDAIDVTGDKAADYLTNATPPTPPPGCSSSGSGGSSTGSGGQNSGSGGGDAAQLGLIESKQGVGQTTGQYAESDIYRNGVGYMFIANGWGTKWASHDISWDGTAFTVLNLNGTQGDDYAPAGYPTMFCGLYSNKQSPPCGLPAAVSSLDSLRTGWRWKSTDTGEYNAAWDIWLSTDGTSLSSYLMVWLRDPPNQRPAGAATESAATVPGLPGTWQVWVGSVNRRPIVNYVRKEGTDLGELEFDVLDVYNDAISKGYDLPGSHILSVAIGFEIWNGPVSGLVTEDFYVDAN